MPFMVVYCSTKFINNNIFTIFITFVFSIKIKSLSLSLPSPFLLVLLSLIVVCGSNLVRGSIFGFALLSNSIFGNLTEELRWFDMFSDRIFVGSLWVFFQLVVVMQ